MLDNDLPPTSSPLSSAQSSQATFQTASSQSHPRHLSARPLPFELLQQVKVYLEESLFTQGLQFLQNLLTSPISANNGGQNGKIPIPPPNYLALLTTLTVHPNFTSRASTPERVVQSNLAFKLLRTLDSIVGPVNSSLTDAYQFRRYDALGPSHIRQRSILDSSDNEDVEDPTRDQLTSIYADEQNLFSLAEDFWSVVGWALNCSALARSSEIHATRWRYWAPWLEYMVEILETDWSLREDSDSTSHSLLYQYVKLAPGGNARGRRILRAVFADGRSGAQKEFREIFAKELKGPRRDKEKEKKEDMAAVDVNNEIYGDWMAEEDTSTDEDDAIKRDDRLTQGRHTKRLRTRTPHRNGTKRTLALQEADESDTSSQDDSNPSASGNSNILGSPESITTRLRLLQLLSTLSASLSFSTPSGPEPIFPDVHELYTLFVEFVRPLPLSTFQSVIMPSSSSSAESGLRPESRIALCEFILQRLVDSDSENQRLSTFEPMTQARLTQEYLPYAAVKNSVEAQAKISLLLESVVRQLAMGGSRSPDVLRRDADLMRILKSGIERREAKASEIRESARGKRGNEKDAELAFLTLKESGRRMEFVVENFVRL